MAKRTAGILLWRRRGADIEVLLVHPGGPFWSTKDDGAWSIPKGLYGPGEEAAAAARREFREETGSAAPDDLIPLGDFPLGNAKVLTAFAAVGEFDVASLASNTFAIEWPPHSGRKQDFPEIDRAAWFPATDAEHKLVPAQRGVVRALLGRL